MAVVKKQRIDKYYNLAKEKGYRARSAFKLLELNKKYNFLKQCRVAVDLCAAPGGWMQILMQEMPPTRKIIGIDLDPIAKLGDCITLQSDITSMECRRELVFQLDNHKADVFVHDGAPNFGNAREKDFFVQNDLVLSALKLATEFLKENGTFVTKIHRSENFSRIVNLLQSLFTSVNVTKPLSSRNESAEIFAVCRNYKNPDFIDPKYFESGFLFKNDEEEVDEYKKITLTDFVLSKSPLDLLKNSGSISLDFESEFVSGELLEYAKDLKLLSISEMRQLLRMRMKIRKNAMRQEIDDVPEALKSLCKIKEEKEVSEEKTALEQLEEEIKKVEKKKTVKEKVVQEFYNDQIFQMENIFKNMKTNVTEVEMKEEPQIMNEDSSCSTDFSMTPSEMECLVMLKEDPEGFKESTIDRNLVESDDGILPGEQRSSRLQLPVPKKITKKEMESLGRKKLRAMRRSNKIMKDIVLEDEEEEAIIHKKIYKNQLKKQKNKKRLVFANVKGGPKRIPRGKGRAMRLDKRMKHDLYIEKNRKKAHGKH